MRLKESMAGGSTGAGAIAVRHDNSRSTHRHDIKYGDREWHKPGAREEKTSGQLSDEARKNLMAAKEKLKKKKSLKGFIADKAKKILRISEAFDLNDVFSKLKSANMNSTENTVSYGIEDDDGNTMRVTVRADQAADFEKRISEELAEIVNLNKSGMSQFKETKKDVSMAELLYRLKDEFDILDVAFPTIPTDGIYNADKVSYNTPDSVDNAMKIAGPDDGDTQGLEDVEAPTDTQDDQADDLGSENMGDEDLEDFDDISTDLEDVDTGSNEKDMMSKILDMLKADAEAKIAQANAEAEKAKALQAEYTARATNATVQQQEELMRMEAQMQAQKDREKEAKKIADLAKFRAQSTKVAESLAFAGSLLREFDEYDTTQTLGRQLAMLRMKFASSPDDTPEVARQKRLDMADARREIMARMNRVRRKENLQRQNSNKPDNQRDQQQNNTAATPTQPVQPIR